MHAKTRFPDARFIMRFAFFQSRDREGADGSNRFLMGAALIRH